MGLKPLQMAEHFHGFHWGVISTPISVELWAQSKL